MTAVDTTRLNSASAGQAAGRGELYSGSHMKIKKVTNEFGYTEIRLTRISLRGKAKKGTIIPIRKGIEELPKRVYWTLN